VAGIQPFVGPTMQAVISQRLSHAPRPVSVFRPTVPVELEQVLAKATAISPADRFQRAGDLGAALEPVTVTPAISKPRGRSSRSYARIVFAIAAVTAVAAAGLEARRSVTADLPRVDTTRVAILPFEATGDSLPYSGEDLMFEGFRHWRGLTPNETYETRDAIRQGVRGELDAAAAAANLTTKEAASLVRSLGAGRFVRGKLINTLGRPKVRATIYDVATSRPLYEASLDLPQAASGVYDAFASLADSLVLRAGATAIGPIPHGSISDLTSAQVFLRGRSALDDWNLVDADSLFALAAASGSQNPRAALWEAQVRSWRGLPPGAWGLLSQVTLTGSTALSASERQLASGLLALKRKDYAAACAAYRQIVNQRPNDFAGWYGLGECHRLDRTVIPDVHSPSGWRFRTSYEQAIQAYRRALKLLPSSYRSLNSNGYAQLQPQLFTDPLFFASGISADSQRFWAWTEVRHDTAEFIPRPMAEMSSPAGSADTAAVARAMNRHRRFFFEIAQSWSTALPNSVGAKEALATALEMIGEPAAADSFAAARRRALDQTQRLRLAVSEAIVRFKIGVSTDQRQLVLASGLTDSILRATSAENSKEFELLTRLAAISGRCALAGKLSISAGGVSPLPSKPIPPSLLRLVDSAFAAAASGCQGTSLPDVAGFLRSTGVGPSDALATEATLFASVVGSRFPNEPDRVAKYASLGMDYVIVAEDQLRRGKTDSARETLAQPLAFKRRAFAGMLAPDAAYTEAKLWLTLGDTNTASWLLDTSLRELRLMQPLRQALFFNTFRLGSVALAADLKSRLSSGDDAKRWRAVVAELWRYADPPLKVRIDRPVPQKH